jgi:hypothetical protein
MMDVSSRASFRTHACNGQGLLARRALSASGHFAFLPRFSAFPVLCETPRELLVADLVNDLLQAKEFN